MMRALVLIVSGAVGCGRLDFADIGAVAQHITISAVYPNHGANWNDYVLADGADRYTASDTACTGTETPYSACLHGGELRKVTLDGTSSCVDLSVTDAHGVFDWTCQVVAGSATFYSSLKPDKGLRDLVTAAGWNADNVIASDSSSTEPGAWWSNPVTELPDNSTPGSGIASLATPSEIYVLSTSRNSDGYDLDAARVSLVTLAGATLTWNASGGNNTYVIGAADQAFVWIEAVIDGTTSFDDLVLTGDQFAQIYGTTVYEGGGNGNHGFSLVADGVTSSQVRHFAVLGGAGGGIDLGASTTSDHNYLDDVAIESLSGTETGAAGVYLHFGTDNLFDGLIVANGANIRLQLGQYCDDGGGGFNTFVDARVFNNAGDGIFVNSHGNHIVNALVVGNGNSGIDLSNACGTADGTVVAGAVVAFNAAHGISEVDDTMSLTNIVSIGNALYGFNVGDPDAWSNLASSDCGSGDIDLFGSSTFAGSLLVTNNASCSNPMNFAGVADGTCAPTGSSTAALYYQGSILGDFVGAVASDSSNQSAIGGTAEFPATPSELDWTHFDNAFRVWGRWDVPGPWITGTGSILDFRLLASATKIFDNTSAVASHNAPFVAGATCPSAVAGDIAISNAYGGNSGFPNQTYLTNAIEIASPSSAGYGAGNHDGLCESGEHCLYTPSFGDYQGEGALATCNFIDGTVAGVTMYGFSSDGQ